MSKKRILLIEDLQSDANLLRSYLEKADFEVLHAAEGETGIQMAIDEQPDLVLMDIVMQGMNGFQATRQLTRSPKTKHIPVVMVSSKEQQVDRIWGERQGARAYLTKPVDEALLLSTINEMIGDQ